MNIRAFMLTLAVACIHSAPAVATPWGANYFPNTALTTQDGNTVRFFEDLIKDKVVVINFIYTTCVDTCPLETAQLTKVQNILGDRLGKDIFFYSITIDPDHDTPSVLKEYRDKFGARWSFLTGNEADIVELRRKLGLYIEEIQDGSNNHNVSMIIGNQRTGRWMKRSPFENPYVLADQIGNWLTDWKSPPRDADYANAPQLRTISDGEQLFRTRCSICHTIDPGAHDDDPIGPDLFAVTWRRDQRWLASWLRAPDRMLANGDPIATALYKQYNELAMPNLRLSEIDVQDLLAYMEEESLRIQNSTVAARATSSGSPNGPVAITGAWIRKAHPGAHANAGYMTLVNTGPQDVTLVAVESPAFDKVEVHEMAMVDDLPRMREATPLPVPAGARTPFAPGGRHMMMIGPKRALEIGQTVNMTLIFDSGITQSVAATVATRAP